MRRVVAVHAIAPFVLSKAALPHLRAAGRGDIIMISSVATLLMSANGAPCSMGKAAQEALARTIAKEERKHGVPFGLSLDIEHAPAWRQECGRSETSQTTAAATSSGVLTPPNGEVASRSRMFAVPRSKATCLSTASLSQSNFRSGWSRAASSTWRLTLRLLVSRRQRNALFAQAKVS
jgi:NAD(P)-dependent dehydrogenase (short-subunit alcohol dehydrogenase family)